MSQNVVEQIVPLFTIFIISELPHIGGNGLFLPGYDIKDTILT